MKHTVLAAALAAFAANSFALSGKVVDGDGEPIASATIDVVGSRQTVAADSTGGFSFASDDVHEIHVTAPGFSHRVVQLDKLEESDSVTIVLNRSSITQVDVIGIPIHASVIESAQPIAVLSGEQLRRRQAATLGDTLEQEVGVHSSFHGNVASTPIIRGLSGPRVLITQNSLDVSDVSRVGPDHAVASEVSTAEQIEVLRGPATLFYGSGAIGGVVNVVDKRVPRDADTFGEWYVAHETVNNQKLGSFNLNTGAGDFAFHADGFWREADDYEVPVPPERGHEHGGDYTVANTADESDGLTLGSSYLLDNGYVGIAVGKMNRQYGIPGHEHGDEEPEADEQGVYADLEQDRVQLVSELDLDHPWLHAINTRAGYTEYTHAEVEGGVVGTLFSNKSSELKVDFLHQALNDWKGGLVLHYKRRELAATGAEAFTPPSDSLALGLAIVEERHFGDVLLQLGGRIERVTISADNVLLPELALHSHDGGEAHDEHDAGAPTRVFSSDQEFTPVSLSVGAVWDFLPGFNTAISLSHSERAPSASELLAFGPHIGTRSYEVGALFELHEDQGDTHFDISDAPFELETSNNIDLTFRKHEGRLGIILNAFYNQVDNYYYQEHSGYFAESAHAHDHDEPNQQPAPGADDEDVHSDELPIYVFASADAVLHGFEAQGIWQVNPSLKTTVFSDYVRAELKDGGRYLPRTPPLRYGAQLDYQWQSVAAHVSWTHYDEQNKVSPMESPTEGYDWLDAVVTWQVPFEATNLELFVKAENITDTEARVHTSFLKDIAPKPGRNFSIGVRGSF